MSIAGDGAVVIRGGEVMLPEGRLERTDVVVAGGVIESIGPVDTDAGFIIDASGALVLPGIVDLHGDAFERQIMPRGGVSFPLDLALMDTDRQMLANGITTAFHAITYSWEPGLRNGETVAGLLDAIEAGRTSFGCDTRIHLRYETFNLDALTDIAIWLEVGRIDLLAFNDHVPSIARKIAGGGSLARYLERTGLSRRSFVRCVESLLDRKDEVPAAIARLAACASAGSVAMASHDDETAATRRDYHALGCRIAEFPLTVEASEESRRLGDRIVLGAPNVLRRGSHLGAAGISAAAEIACGRGDILCSDYYYPALLQAPFILASDSVLGFPEAWRMVSANPARAAGLDDRGEIGTGKRADLLVVRQPERGPVMVSAAVSAGRPVYRSGLF